MSNFIKHVWLLNIAIFLSFTSNIYSYSSIETTEIPFTGIASGGEIILCSTLNRNCRFVSITTLPGEIAESIAARLASKINQENPFDWISLGKKSTSHKATASGGTLKGLIGSADMYLLAGTENGLGIPPSPLFLSCACKEPSKELMLSWVNPEENYDKIAILINWSNYDGIGTQFLPGNTTKFAIDSNKYQYGPMPIDFQDLDIWVIGYRNGIPSNAAASHITKEGLVQEELYGIPFTEGVAPNWKRWSTDRINKTDFQGRVRQDKTAKENKKIANFVTEHEEKPFYQILKTPEQGGITGIYRKFIGLQSGHTYRLYACLNTLGMDSNNANWQYSLHVAYNDPDGKEITANQMAGLEALPDKSKGMSAGQVCRFDNQKVTQGKYEECSKEITLPEGVDTITVWLRFNSKTVGEVGMDYIKLEDLEKK